MSLRKKKKQLVAAALVVLMAVGTGVPAMVANAPIVFAGGQYHQHTDNAGNVFDWAIFDENDRPVYVGDGGTIADIIPAEGVTAITIPRVVTNNFGGKATITTIGSIASSGKIKNITSFTISEGITDIWRDAFENCTKLTDVTIPKSMSIIYCGAFEGCTNLKNIYYAGNEQEWKALLESSKNFLGESPIPQGVTVHYNKSGNNNAETVPVTGLIYNGRAYDGCITLDTANYVMAPGNIYDIGNFMKDSNGNQLSDTQIRALVSNGKLKVSDSRNGSVVNLSQLSNGNFRVTGKNPGTTYIVYVIGNTHASIRIDVQNGVKQHGTAVRNTSYYNE